MAEAGSVGKRQGQGAVGEGEKSSVELEISDVNPSVRRPPGGAWGEDVLPVVEWEAAAFRVVLPTDLQRILGWPTPVLRWSAIKLEAIAVRHRRDMRVVAELNVHLRNWRWVGEEPHPHEGQYRILFHGENRRWYALTVGQDRRGSYNVVTVFSGSDQGFLRNRLRHLGNVVRREE